MSRHPCVNLEPGEPRLTLYALYIFTSFCVWEGRRRRREKHLEERKRIFLFLEAHWTGAQHATRCPWKVVIFFHLIFFFFSSLLLEASSATRILPWPRWPALLLCDGGKEASWHLRADKCERQRFRPSRVGKTKRLCIVQQKEEMLFFFYPGCPRNCCNPRRLGGDSFFLNRLNITDSDSPSCFVFLTSLPRPPDFCSK